MKFILQDHPRRVHRSTRGFLRFLFAVALSALVVTPVFAGRYELVKGRGVEVCEAYEKALNAPPPNRIPASCQRIVPKDPKNPGEAKDFSQPVWKEINKWKNEALMRDIWEYQFSHNVNPVRKYPVNQWNEWQGAPEQIALAHQFFIKYGEDNWGVPDYIATFDIDNDGTPEPIYFDRACTGMTGGHALFVVLNPDGLSIDHEKTERTQAHPPFMATGRDVFRPAVRREWGVYQMDIDRGFVPLEDAWNWAAYDFFFYKGKTYYDLWWVRHPDYHGQSDRKAGRLRVFITEKHEKPREVCTYRYRDDSP